MKLILGDCLERMKELEDNSIDSIVSDPPYGISFMSKKWDYDVPKVEVWEEVLRVLKPGGHALVACGTRTQHRMAVNLEDAGFEIRDIVAWVYGSGFPKSHNIGKAVDKIQGNKREVTGKYLAPDGKERGGVANNPMDISNYKVGDRSEHNTTKGVSKFEGWGTALKPAMELWTLCRKPLSEKTIASNCLKWGTGGINIDECRVEISENDNQSWRKGEYNYIKGSVGATNDENRTYRKDKPTGRFPANFIHDGSDEVVGEFPNSSTTGKRSKIHRKTSGMATNFTMGNPLAEYTDSGSASRFFYCAKASKKERNKGLEGFEEKKQDESRKEGNPGGDNPRNRGVNKTQNFHPTVKPVKLMRYLCRLITPKGGVILDPFMGSGTTGIGAKLEGFDFIGIEIDKDYMEIAKARIENWKIEEQLKLDKEE